MRRCTKVANVIDYLLDLLLDNRLKGLAGNLLCATNLASMGAYRRGQPAASMTLGSSARRVLTAHNCAVLLLPCRPHPLSSSFALCPRRLTPGPAPPGIHALWLPEALTKDRKRTEYIPCSPAGLCGAVTPGSGPECPWKQALP